jgi:hypothetical protein
MNVSFVNNTSVTERMNLKFSFDVFNITDTPGVDVPIERLHCPQPAEARTRAATTAPEVWAT